MDRNSSPAGQTTTMSSVTSRRQDNSDHGDDEDDVFSNGSTEDSTLPCRLLCWYLLSWSFSILTYVAEGFAVVWVAIHYLTFDLYLTASVTLAAYFVASLINGAISLFWYYDLDRVSLRQLEASGPFPGSYKRKCSFAAIASHCLLLGEIYRYGELMVRFLLTKHTSTLRVLRRDATLLRFFHAFVITAPQIIIHLYTVTVATDSTHPDHESYSNVVSFRAVLSVLGVCIVSLAYSIATYVTSDRLTSKTRRVILPAHLTLYAWYACLVVSRILALTLFAHAFGYFVLVFVIAHWVLSVFGILNQKSQFCADYGHRPRKQRWWLEVPFSFYAACLYQFVYFSLREGKTRYALSVYLVVTLIENSLMVVMFFTEYRSLWYAPASVAVVIGLFLLGALLLAVYYLVLHPHKTEDWYWIGFPRKCCSLVSGKGKSYRPHTIEISQPTLVNMNGQATNLPISQTRSTGIQPLTNILTRNKTTGQMQLMAPPQVIESGLTGSEDYYKKPRVHGPQSSSVRPSVSESHSRSSSRYQTPNSVPSRNSSHTLGSGSHTPSNTLPRSLDPSHENEIVPMLRIPATASLGSSLRTESDDMEIGGSGVPESDPSMEPYNIHSHHGVGLHIDSQLQSTFQALEMGVPVPNHSAVASGPDRISDNANASNANRHDIDIDSPFTSPYDTLDNVREEAALTIKDVETILEGNEINDNEGGRYSASPPNLPTPDFTDHSLIPGNPHNQPFNQLHHREQDHGSGNNAMLSDGIPLPVPVLLPPQQKIPPPPLSVPPADNPRVAEEGHEEDVAQLQMFQGIPAKRDYDSHQPSKLEQHYFPEPNSHSTPNLAAASRGPNISTLGVPQSASTATNSLARGVLGSEAHWKSSSDPPNTTVPQAPLPPPANIGPPPPPPPPPPSSTIKPERGPGGQSSGVKPSNSSPERTRGRRGGRGRGGNRNNSRGERKTSHQPQSYYAYGSGASKVPPGGRQNPSNRAHSFHVPQVSAENRQKLFGRNIPVAMAGPVAPGNPAMQSPWQQKQRSTLPARVLIPVQKPNRSPDRSRAAVTFQPAPDQTPMRPRSYSEGTTLESSPSQERRKSGGPPQPILPPQYSQHFLGRSPGAPRRGGPQQNSYFAPSDRTQVLNLTWTSPRLHHDPAISGGGSGPSNDHPQQQQFRKTSAYEPSGHGNGGGARNAHGHAPFINTRSQTAYELSGSHRNQDPVNSHSVGRVNPGRWVSNPLQPAGVGGHPHGARKISTNHSAGMATTNPLLHVPAQSSHTSRV